MKKGLIWYVLAFILCIVGWVYYSSKEKTDITAEQEIPAVVPVEEELPSDVNHLKFKGVAIDGTLSNFVGRMERMGFKVINSKGGTAVLKGDFADFKKCLVYVSTLDNKDLVSRISVVFPSRETWDNLYGDYKHLKELLTEKYGQPSAVKEQFQGEYIHNDQDKMFAVGMDECKYESRFQTDEGEIVLWIGHEDMSSCFVALSYQDGINGEIINKHAIGDL